MKRAVPAGRVDAEFEAFVRDSATSLLRTSYLLVGDRAEAEDVLQDALARTLRKWSVARDAPQAYCRRIVINLVHDRWRARNRRPKPVEVDLGAMQADERPLDQLHDRLVLVGALRRLPEQQRAVAVLRFWDGLSVEETAELLAISTGTVKSYTSRALARLRELILEETETS